MNTYAVAFDVVVADTEKRPSKGVPQVSASIQGSRRFLPLEKAGLTGAAFRDNRMEDLLGGCGSAIDFVT
jgi:hypothetical protein